MLPVNARGYAAIFAVLAIFAAGFAAAWNWRAGHVAEADARTVQARADFAAYVAEATRLTNEATIRAAKQREEADHDWKETVERLQRDRLAFDRCVAAGRCGVQRVCPAGPQTPAGSGGKTAAVSAAGQPDGASAGAVSIAEGLATDCAAAVAQANALQADIERQPGYRTP